MLQAQTAMQIETPPSEKPYDKAEGERRGLVIVNTGDGKGKSTAAFGLAFRALGRGKAVKVFQFMKVPTARFGEHRLAERVGLPVEGLGDGFSWKSKDLDHSAQLAREGWDKAKAAILSGAYFLVVLDEVTYPDLWLVAAAGSPRYPAGTTERRACVPHGPPLPAGAHRHRGHGDRDADDQARLSGRHSCATRH